MDEPGATKMKSVTLKTPSLPNESVSISLCFLNDFELSHEEIKALLPNLNCALINPSLIVSIDQLNCAIMKVLVAASSMKTRSKYTELLFSLSPSTNVTEALKTFGFSNQNSAAIAVRFDCEDSEAFAQEMEERLKCTALQYDSSLFAKNSDLELVKKTYKLTTTGAPLKEICSIIASKGI